MSTSVFQSIPLGSSSGAVNTGLPHGHGGRRQSLAEGNHSEAPTGGSAGTLLGMCSNQYVASRTSVEGELGKQPYHHQRRLGTEDAQRGNQMYHNSPPTGATAVSAVPPGCSAQLHTARAGASLDSHISSDSLPRQHRAPSYDSSMSTHSIDQSAGLPHSNRFHGAGSLGLTHHRRHAASMTAAIRGGGSDGLGAADEARSGFRSRAASWAVESPKKLRATRGGGLVSDAARKVCGSSKVIDTACSSWFARQLLESRFLNKKAVKDNRREFLGWVLLVGLIIIGYKFFSDGSFSAILTLASAFQCFALALLFTKVLVQQSVSGVSQRSLVLIATCLICRLISTVFYNGYLPVDRSGDWIYQLADAFTVFLTLALLLYARWYCRTSVQSQQEKDTCYIGIPVAVLAIFAVLVHPSLNQNILADISWTAGLYIETLAMIPQLFMMSKLPGEVEAVTSHYVASMAASKVFAFLFWYFSYTELAPRGGGRNTAGYAVVFSYFIQVVLFADFLYYYIKSLKVGKRMIINF